MKSYRLAFSLLISGLFLTPAAFAQLGMDTQYNQSLNNQANQASGAAASTAATGSGANTTQTSAWADKAYVVGQQMLAKPVSALTNTLPKMQNGLNAPTGFNQALDYSCDWSGPGGFPMLVLPSRTSPYKNLLPTSTSIDVDLNVVE